MAEETPEAAEIKKETAIDENLDIESQIREAMRSRIIHFKEQSDSLTFEGVRRQIEKDMGLQKFALDVHKRFVKQLLLEQLDAATNNNGSKEKEEAGEEFVHSLKEEIAEAQHGERGLKNSKVEPSSDNEDKMEDSPVMGLLTGQEKDKSETEDSQPKKSEEAISESTIKKALWKRASYVKENAEKITMAGLRRMLEEDMKLDKFALDPYKKFINKQLDELIKSKDASKTGKKVSKSSAGKVANKGRGKGSSESVVNDSDEEEVNPRRKTGKIVKSEEPRKRKAPEKEIKVSAKKRTKPAEKVGADSSDSGDGGNASDNSHSQSSAETPVKKKEASTPVYGKRIEHLKSVIKTCGMSVPPAIYKKVKQVPESRRESQLIKELEDILSKEGLSSNPSEKEIKEVRKRKERAKELEGIDTSNIVSSSRRRSTTCYAPPPKPELPVDSDNDDADESDDDDEDDDGDEDGDDDVDDDGGNDDNDNNNDNEDNEEDDNQSEDRDEEPDGESE